jgi:hypothetical protein
MKTYIEEFQGFTTEHESTAKTGDEISDMLIKMVNYFCTINAELSLAENEYHSLLATVVKSDDEKTSKPIAISKAEILAKDSVEYHKVNELRKHLINLEQIINGLKAKLRGATNEFSHLSNT